MAWDLVGGSSWAVELLAKLKYGYDYGIHELGGCGYLLPHCDMACPNFESVKDRIND